MRVAPKHAHYVVTSIEQRMGPMRRWHIQLLLTVVFLAGTVQHAGAYGTITGTLPPAGGFGLVVWTGGSMDEFAAAAGAGGCTTRSTWTAANDGTFVGYINGAPDVVNVPWRAVHGGSGQLPPGAVLVVCAGAARAPASVFDRAQVLSLYGYPGIPIMGILGALTPEAAADEALRRAAEFDALNGSRSVLAAFEPIVVVAQASPGASGQYIGRMEEAVLQSYIDVARARDMLVILDLQIGWADPVAEVARLEPLLALPFVHLALDPEYMTKQKGEAPGQAIGTITAEQVNAAQEQLDAIVRRHHLPPKMLVVHQFREDMVQVPTGHFADFFTVDVVIDMDGFGPASGKLSKYELFARSSYAERAGLKLFLAWDSPLLTPADILALQEPPDLVIYQ
jgi:hypothetical protein